MNENKTYNQFQIIGLILIPCDREDCNNCLHIGFKSRNELYKIQKIAIQHPWLCKDHEYSTDPWPGWSQYFN